MTNNRAPVSVIIPCYNCHATINRAVESVFRQTFRPLELVLVNDASDSATTCLLFDLKAKYGSWIKLLNSAVNVGASTARNLGWDAATQPYVAFLDSDDAWHLLKIEIQYGYMVKNPSIVLSGHGFRELPHDTEESPSWRLNSTSASSVTWFGLLFRNRFVTPSVMTKRDLSFRFLKSRRYMEDHLLWLQVAQANQPIAKIEADLVAIYKPAYGSAGLSSHLWAMEMGELANYRFVHESGGIGLLTYLFFLAFSLTKFCKRLLYTYLILPFK